MAEQRPPLDRIYADAQIGGRVGFGLSPAVLVVDMTVAFCDPGYAVGSDQQPALDAIAELLGEARAKSVAVFFATTAFPDDPAFTSPFVTKIPGLRELKVNDPAATTVHPSLEPAPGELVINKEQASPFFGTNLTTALVGAGVDTLILTGCSTSGCIRAAAVDASALGLRVIVPRECVSDRAPEPHEANLFDIDMKYGDVMSLGSVIEQIRRIEATVRVEAHI